MKNAKFIILIVIILSLSLSLFACKPADGDSQVDDPYTVVVGVPDGAPALAIAKLLQDKPTFEGYNISYQIIFGGATAITALATQNSVDLLIAPTNLGAILYNKLPESNIKLTANLFNSLLYLVGKDQSITSLENLKGKVVYAIGQGATPDLTFQYILTQKGIKFAFKDDPKSDEIGIMYENDASVILPKIKNNQIQFAILGEPAVTKATTSFSCYSLFNFNDLWNEVNETTSGFPQASLFTLGGISDSQHAPFIDWLISQLEGNKTWVRDNPTIAQEILQQNEWSTPVDLDAELIDRCNMQVKMGNEAQNMIDQYLNTLFTMDPKTVGGSLPSRDFYYWNS